MSSLSGLNAAPSTATLRAEERAAEHLAGQVDHPGAAPHVDRVDLAQEGQRLVGAQLAGPGHERPDVLGQAAAAEAEAGVEEPAADPRRRGRSRRPAATTSAPAASHTSAIALMNEILVARNALAATLTSSAVGVVGDHEGRARRDRRRVDLVAAALGRRAARLGRHAVDQPVGVQGVLHGEALAQELGVPGQLSVAPAGAARRACGEPGGGADRHGRLADDQVARPQVRERARRPRAST